MPMALGKMPEPELPPHNANARLRSFNVAPWGSEFLVAIDGPDHREYGEEFRTQLMLAHVVVPWSAKLVSPYKSRNTSFYEAIAIPKQNVSKRVVEWA